MKRVLVNTKDQWDKRDFVSPAIVEDDGAIKWESNNRYLMEDTMDRIIANGFSEFSREETSRKREIQNKEFIAQYRHSPSQEELVEMRAAYGEGTVVVDVISGERIVL